MAHVTIRRSDAPALPLVCAECGRPASGSRSDTYTWYPSWVGWTVLAGVLPWVIFSCLTRRSATLALPVCSRHARRPRRALAVMVTGFVLAAAAVGVGSAINQKDPELGGNIILGGVGVIVLSGLAAVFVSGGRIDAAAIDARTVTLSGVSDGFAEAVASGPRARPTTWGGGFELATARYL